jgi:hypothetical protein
MKTINLFNPDKFGISMTGISLQYKDSQYKDNPGDFPGKDGDCSKSPSIMHSSDKIKLISELKNSLKYKIRNALILCCGDYYRLIVINENVLLMNESYKTAKGAKIAFMRKFSHKIFKHIKNRTRPEWSKFLTIETNIDLKSIFPGMSQV